MINSQEHRANESREQPTGKGGRGGGGGGYSPSQDRRGSTFLRDDEGSGCLAEEFFPTASASSRGQPAAASTAANEAPVPFAAATASGGGGGVAACISADAHDADANADADAGAATAAAATAAVTATAARTQFSIEVSYLEIYNETLRDLFNPAPPLTGVSDSGGPSGEWGVGTGGSSSVGVGNTFGTTGLRLREDPR